MHSSLAGSRWRKLSLLEQLGNIGSEVGRAIRAGDKDRRQKAAYRALELFDLTLDDKRWRGRGSEIARARELFCDFIFGSNTYRVDGASLEKYFTHFALAARLHR